MIREPDYGPSGEAGGEDELRLAREAIDGQLIDLSSIVPECNFYWDVVYKPEPGEDFDCFNLCLSSDSGPNGQRYIQFSVPSSQPDRNDGTSITLVQPKLNSAWVAKFPEDFDTTQADKLRGFFAPDILPAALEGLMDMVAMPVWEAAVGRSHEAIEAEKGGHIWDALTTMLDVDGFAMRYSFTHTIPDQAGEISIYTHGIMPRFGETMFPLHERGMAMVGVRQAGNFAYKMFVQDGELYETFEENFQERAVNATDLWRVRDMLALGLSSQR